MAKQIFAFIFLSAIALQSATATPLLGVGSIIPSFGDSLISASSYISGATGAVIQDARDALQDAVARASKILGPNAAVLRTSVVDSINTSRDKLADTYVSLKATMGQTTTALQQIGTNAVSRVMADIETMYDNIGRLSLQLRDNAQQNVANIIRPVIDVQTAAINRLTTATQGLVRNSISARAYMGEQVGALGDILAGARTIVTNPREAFRTQVESAKVLVDSARELIDNFGDYADAKVADAKVEMNRLAAYVSETATKATEAAQNSAIVKEFNDRIADSSAKIAKLLSYA